MLFVKTKVMHLKLFGIMTFLAVCSSYNNNNDDDDKLTAARTFVHSLLHVFINL